MAQIVISGWMDKQLTYSVYIRQNAVTVLEHNWNFRSYSRTKKPHIKVHFLFNFICIKRSKLVKSKDRSRGVRWGLQVDGDEKKLHNSSEVSLPVDRSISEQVGLCNSVVSDNITATLSPIHFKILNFMLCEFCFHEKEQGRVYGSVRREDRKG